MNSTIEERLASLGVTKENIPDYAEVLRKVSTIAELGLVLTERHRTCDEEQYLAPPFKRLYTRDPVVRERVKRDLASSGVNDDVVTKYFTELGDCLGIAFHLTYEDEIPLETRENFVLRADQSMLTIFREYLGVA